jgi:hypothetical protein
MRRTALPALVALALVVAACGDDDAPARPDSIASATPDSVPATPATAAVSRWEAGYGPALFATNSNGVVELVAPDITDSTFADSAAWTGVSLGGASQVEFFSRAGRVTAVRLATATAIPAPELHESCVGWPTLRVLDPVPSQWMAGFAPGHASAIPLDSIEALAAGDSARLAADAARIASQIRNDTAVAFAGLPFTVRTAYRLRLGGDTVALVADLTRRIGQEANPREQHLLLLAERASPTAPWQLAWQVRSSGTEEEVETRDLLAAVRLGPAGTPAIVVGVSDNDGVSYQLVTRTAPGSWSERWSSAYTGC